jgi:hypothetical protein
MYAKSSFMILTVRTTAAGFPQLIKPAEKSRDFEIFQVFREKIGRTLKSG